MKKLLIIALGLFLIAQPLQAQKRNALTKGKLERQDFSPAGIWTILGLFDFLNATVRMQRGTCPPAATLCDDSDGTEEGTFFLCTDLTTTNPLYACLNDDSVSGGWQRVLIKNTDGLTYNDLGATIRVKLLKSESPLTLAFLTCSNPSAGDCEMELTVSGGFGPFKAGLQADDGNFDFEWNETTDHTLDVKNIGTGKANIRADENIIASNEFYQERGTALRRFPMATRYEAANMVGRGPIVNISLDDSCGGQYTNLFPLVLKYRIPVTLFITPDRLGQIPGPGCGDASIPYLTLAQVLEMDRSGLVEIAAHSWDHDIPDIQLAADQDAFWTEEQLVFDWFNTNLGHPPYSYAAPGGGFGDPIIDNYPVSGDPDVVAALRTLGYENGREAGGNEGRLGSMGGLYKIGTLGLECTKPISGGDADGNDYIDIVKTSVGDANSSFGIALFSHQVFPSGTCVPTSNVDAADIDVLFSWLRDRTDDGELEVVTFREYARRLYGHQRNMVFNPNFYEFYGVGEQFDGNPAGLGIGPQGWNLATGWDICITHLFHGKATITHTACSPEKQTTLTQTVNGLIPGARYSLAMHLNVTDSYVGDVGIHINPRDHANADDGLFRALYAITALGHHFVEYEFIPSTDSMSLDIIVKGSTGAVEIDGVNIFPAFDENDRPGAGTAGSSHFNMYAGWPRTVALASTTAAASGTQSLDWLMFNTGVSARSFSNRFLVYRMLNAITGCTDWQIDFCDLAGCTGNDTFHTVDETMGAEVWNEVFYYENEDYPSDVRSSKIHGKLTNNDSVNACAGIFLIEAQPMGLQEYGAGGYRRKEN